MKNKYIFILILLIIIGGGVLIEFNCLALGIILVCVGGICFVFFPLLCEILNN